MGASTRTHTLTLSLLTCRFFRSKCTLVGFAAHSGYSPAQQCFVTLACYCSLSGDDESSTQPWIRFDDTSADIIAHGGPPASAVTASPSSLLLDADDSSGVSHALSECCRRGDVPCLLFYQSLATPEDSDDNDSADDSDGAGKSSSPSSDDDGGGGLDGGVRGGPADVVSTAASAAPSPSVWARGMTPAAIVVAAPGVDSKLTAAPARSPVTAPPTVVAAAPAAGKPTGGKADKKGGSYGNVRCLECGSLGHLQKNCPSVSCRRCGKIGHMSAACTAAVGSASGVGKPSDSPAPRPYVPFTPSHSRPHSLTCAPSLPSSLHSLTHALHPSLPPSLTHSLTRSLTRSLPRSITSYLILATSVQSGHSL